MLKRYSLRGEIIEDVGRALYGPNWQRQLARNLGVSEMSIRRWRLGTTSMPATAVDEMAKLLSERQQQIASTHQQLCSETFAAA